MLEDDKHSLGNQISWVLCQVVKLTARLTMYLLHFVAFFHVASLFSTGVDNEKALELDNRTFFSYFSLISM